MNAQFRSQFTPLNKNTMAYKDAIKATINPAYNDQYPEIAGVTLTFLECYGGDRYYCVAPVGYTGYVNQDGHIPAPSMPSAHWHCKSIVRSPKADRYRRADEITAALTAMDPASIAELHQPIPGTSLVVILGLVFAHFGPGHPYFNDTDLTGGLSRYRRANYTEGAGIYTDLCGPDALHRFYESKNELESA